MPLRAAFRRFLSTGAADGPTPKLRNIPSYRLRHAAIPAARAAVSEYLHSTRGLPASHADSIAAHSPRSVLAFLAAIPSVPSNIAIAELQGHFRRHLAFNPLNEVPFFLESIGAPPHDSLPRSDLMFLGDHPNLLYAVAALVHYGFPWSRLGVLFPTVLLSVDPDLISARLAALEARLHQLPRAAIIAACLNFPSLLECDLSDGDPLVKDLGTAFLSLGPDLSSSNIEAFSGVCRRMQMFYDAGAEVGSIGGLVGCSRSVFLELSEKRIDQRLAFFKELGMSEKELARFLLNNAWVFNLDFSDVVISVPEYLQRVGLANDMINEAVRNYPYVVGKNRLENLPRVLRAMGLEHEFLEKISPGRESLQCLTQDFVLEDDSYDAEVERAFLDGLEKVKAVMKMEYVDQKLKFLKSIGYGENEITARLVLGMNSTQDLLQERFDCLLESGIGYKILCRILSVCPKLINQGKESLKQKLDYFTEELGYSLDYLECFPAFLNFDLEKRTKPRYMMLRWLQEHGLLTKTLAPATVLANSEKRFISSLYFMHPAAPKVWLECFSSRTHMEYYLDNLFRQHQDNK